MDYDELRKKVWGEGSVTLPSRPHVVKRKNLYAKELLQGNGQYQQRVVEGNRKAIAGTKQPRYGKKEFLKELDENEKE